ncbi:MAG TPA: hypothetical protein VGI45_26390, partial [Terracidiphilus sp.]
MRRFFHLVNASLILLIACNSAKTPNEANFTKAINEYLAKHGSTCTVIGRQFPIDLPQSEQQEKFGIAPKLAALEQAGLVRATDTTAVVHGMLDPLRGSTPPQPVKRYELTADGQKYFQQIPTALGQTGALCYGRGRDDPHGSPTGWPEAVTHPRLPQNPACRFPALGSSDVDSQYGDSL